MAGIARDDCVALDLRNPLGHLRDLFSLPDGTIYLDGNSLGALPVATLARITDTVVNEWGIGLIRSWNSANWMELTSTVGDKIARLVGAEPGEVIITDSTSVNIFKVLSFAAEIGQRADSQRRSIVVERDTFPTDVYMADSVARIHGMKVVNAPTAELGEVITQPSTAVVLLTHVDYRSGAMHDMAAITRVAHEAGALVVWDLSHSAGAVPIDLHGVDADFAIGCGYKFLNGGPGAPSFVWVHPRLVNEPVSQPLCGWLGHASPFAFSDEYSPASGVRRFLCGTPPVLSLAALDCGVDTVLAAESHGGVGALHQNALALSSLFAELVEQRVASHGIRCVTDTTTPQRGSHLSFVAPTGAYAIVQALIHRGVVGDYREPDFMRFGITPLYTRFVDIWDAVEQLTQVLDSGDWKLPQYSERKAIT